MLEAKSLNAIYENSEDQYYSGNAKNLLVNFLHIWTPCQKIALPIFEIWYINRNMEQSV